VAALIKTQFNQETTLEPGGRGEFTIWVDGKKVAEKTRTGFPGEPALVESLKAALE
jgi:predicted Rdx family selenoprotein